MQHVCRPSLRFREHAAEYDPASQPPPPPRKGWAAMIASISEPFLGLIKRQWKLILFVYAVCAVVFVYSLMQSRLEHTAT